MDAPELITFGMSYYSGGIDIQEDVLEKSKERSKNVNFLLKMTK